VHERYRQTTDRRQTTDGRAIAYSEREREFTFAKNALVHFVKRRRTWRPRTLQYYNIQAYSRARISYHQHIMQSSLIEFYLNQRFACNLFIQAVTNCEYCMFCASVRYAGCPKI